MTQQKFSYPDIPFTSDRAMYDYLFRLDRLLREHGKAISELIELVNKHGL